MEGKKHVFVTRMIPEPAIELLKKTCEVEVNGEDRVLKKDELLDKVKGKDAVLCLLTDTIDDEVLKAADRCKIFANYAVGYNNIDVESATRRKIIITNTPGVLTDATGDLAWALLFAVARRVVEADAFTRQGKFKGWAPQLFLGQDITGKTLGVIGAGRIGSNFAKKSKGFSMRILYYDVKRDLEFEQEAKAVFVDLDTLLKEADFVSIHVPLVPETRHLIGARELSLMKKNAILINTSRGPVVDEKALVNALKEGKIWGAGLDVYENEPDIEPELLNLANVVLLPHIASATYETRTKMALMAAENILAVFRGETPPNIVNPDALKK
ncbi:MAG TPA: D-glycerate dehydrogenase [bacterium]|nr:D-glycerate dehydrogenase [bacterium]HOL50344.1 D-glycerate dehydrogenase [bacterium]HPO52735.1 D-glycerate dehydrogenase [bacterium]